jgi:acetyltransferase-like isoleucine patch superfamily enzyme
VVKTAQVGEGSVVFAQSYVSDHVQTGQHTSINFACTLNHDTILGDFVSLGPRVSLCGGVKVDSLCELGASVTVIPNVQIHSGVMVGAGAVVTRALAAGVTATGVPARAK